MGKAGDVEDVDIGPRGEEGCMVVETGEICEAADILDRFGEEGCKDNEKSRKRKGGEKWGEGRKLMKCFLH